MKILHGVDNKKIINIYKKSKSATRFTYTKEGDKTVTNINKTIKIETHKKPLVSAKNKILALGEAKIASMTLREVADSIGTTISNASVTLKKAGYKAKPARSKDVEKKFLDLQNKEKMTVAEIMNKLDCSESSVRFYADVHKINVIKRRSKSCEQ